MDTSADVIAKPDAGGKDATVDATPDATVDATPDAEADAEFDVDVLDASDGSPGIDAGSSDSSMVCNQNFGFGSVSMNGCSAGENWTCGNDTYEVECFCPGLACTCTKNNMAVNKVVAMSGCPACSFNAASIAALCNFPH